MIFHVHVSIERCGALSVWSAFGELRVAEVKFGINENSFGLAAELR